MLVDRADVVGGAEVRGLARLPHQVDEVCLDAPATCGSPRDAVHQQIGDHAGEQRPGPSVITSASAMALQRGRQRPALPRPQADRLDAAAAAADARLAATLAPSARVASSDTLAAGGRDRCGRRS